MTWQEDLKRRFRLDNSQVQSLEALLRLLLARKDRHLTAVTEPAGIVRVHFLDSLSLLEFPEVLRAKKAVDIGSGAGFPGLPLAIARPDLDVALIEANRKKCDFIGRTIIELKLKNASVHAIRAEAAGRSTFRDSADLALARAVGSLPEVLEYALPLLKSGGHALLQRGAREPRDEELAASVAGLLGGKLARVEKSSPYPEAKNLHIWVFDKIGETPFKYPRRPGMARKRPLQP